MNWRAFQESDEQPVNKKYLIDIIPDTIPHQSGEDGDALVRISRPGWRWWIKEWREQKKDSRWVWVEDGYEEHRAAAIASAVEALAKLRQ